MLFPRQISEPGWSVVLLIVIHRRPGLLIIPATHPPSDIGGLNGEFVWRFLRRSLISLSVRLSLYPVLLACMHSFIRPSIYLYTPALIHTFLQPFLHPSILSCIHSFLQFLGKAIPSVSAFKLIICLIFIACKQHDRSLFWHLWSSVFTLFFIIPPSFLPDASIYFFSMFIALSKNFIRITMVIGMHWWGHSWKRLELEEAKNDTQWSARHWLEFQQQSLRELRVDVSIPDALGVNL